VFSLDQVKKDFQDISESALSLALSRLSGKNRIISIYKGFYLIVPPEYSSRGLLPPVNFIHDLMQYIGKPYYVGLLSAAALHGAAHQQPQEFFVVTTSKQLTTLKKGLKINYITKKTIPVKLLDKRKTETGFIYISNPELTAADLVYYDNRIGGLNRVTTVLHELAEVMKPGQITEEFINNLSVPAIQRLGYLLDKVLKKSRLADRLFNESRKQNKVFYRQPLKSGAKKIGFHTDDKWKVIINIDIEIGE